MAPRKKSDEFAHLTTPNLKAERKGDSVYYSWQNPQTGKKISLKATNDEAQAIKKAEQLNDRLLEMGLDPTLVVASQGGMTMAQLAKEYLPKALTHCKATSSVKRTRGAIRRIENSELGKMYIKRVNTQHLTAYLRETTYNPVTDEWNSLYSRYRYHLEQMFLFAMSRGWLHFNHGNPAAVIEKLPDPDKKRQRLIADWADAIYREAGLALQLTMDIMTHTTMRPANAVMLQHCQFVPKDRAFRLKTVKTGKLIEFKLAAPDLVELIVQRSRFSGMNSPYIVHQKPGRATAKKNWPAWRKCPFQVSVDTISVEFSEIRDRLGICSDIPKQHRPPLYEMRSLAGALHMEEGYSMDHMRQVFTHTEEDQSEDYIVGHDVVLDSVKCGISKRWGQ